MESHTATNPQLSCGVLPGFGHRTFAVGIVIVLVASAVAPAESQIVELEPGSYTYQHAQLMADAHTRSFGDRRPPAAGCTTVRDEELTDLCKHLDSLQEQIRQTEQRLADLNLATAPGPEPMCKPVYQVDGEIAELNHRREKLAEQANRQTMELRELREHLASRERGIAAELLTIHEQMQSIEKQLVGLDHRRQEHIERLVAAQRQLQEIEARLRDLMAEVAGMRQNVGERIGQNHRQEEVIHSAIEQTRHEAQGVRDQLEEIRRMHGGAAELTWEPRRTWAPPCPAPAPVAAPVNPKVEVEIKLLREEVVHLRQQLEAPKRVEMVCVENPYAVGSARGYFLPCR